MVAPMTARAAGVIEVWDITGSTCSCPGRASAASEDPGLRATSDGEQKLMGPGSRYARPGHEGEIHAERASAPSIMSTVFLSP